VIHSFYFLCLSNSHRVPRSAIFLDLVNSAIKALQRLHLKGLIDVVPAQGDHHTATLTDIGVSRRSGWLVEADWHIAATALCDGGRHKVSAIESWI